MELGLQEQLSANYITLYVNYVVSWHSKNIHIYMTFYYSIHTVILLKNNVEHAISIF